MGQNQKCVELVTRETTVEICALDGEGYVHSKGVEHKRAKAGITYRTWYSADRQ